MGMSRIHLTIGRLQLNGLQPGQEKALVESLRTQLTQMLADRSTRGEWAHSHRTPVVKLGPVPLQSGPSGGRQIGANIARGIGRGLKT
jgi:hypothetical protein